MATKKFDVFAVMRRVRDDAELSSTQKLVLLTAALRTNTSGRVRASQELLAGDACLSEKSIRRALQSAPVQRYLAMTPTGRQVNLDWRPDAVPMADCVSPIHSGLSVPDTGLSVPDTGHSVQPSTTSSTNKPSTSSSTPSSSADTASAALPRALDLTKIQILRTIHVAIRTPASGFTLNRSHGLSCPAKYLPKDRYNELVELDTLDLVKHLFENPHLLRLWWEEMQTKLDTEELMIASAA